MICGKCGKELDESASFCSNCGMPINQEVTGNMEQSSEEPKEKKKKMGRKTIVLITTICCVAVIAVFGAVITSQPFFKYAVAERSFANENFERAIKYYTAAGDYKDASEKLKDAVLADHYAKAMQLFKNEKYDEAIVEFERADEYKTSSEMLKQCNYIKGKNYLKTKKYLQAAESFQEASGYKDANKRIIAIGKGLVEDREYKDAFIAYSYANNGTEEPYAQYASGMINFGEGKYPDAHTNFKKAGDIFDAPDLANACNLYLAKANADSGNLNQAKEQLEALPADYTYQSMSVSDLLGRINANSQWVALCGKWNSISGQARTLSKSHTGYSTWWNSDINTDVNTIEVRCILNEDGTVTLNGRGSISVFTNFSTISAALNSEAHRFLIIQNVTDVGTITVDGNTTLTLSGDKITLSYEKIEDNKDAFFTYTYTTNCTFGKTSSY